MTKAVFITKISPSYDDLPEVRYHFPATYLRVAQAALNDWIVYYEPRRSDSRLNSLGGRQAYFATAKVAAITKDDYNENCFYAHVTDFIEFDKAVSFKDDKFYYESALVKQDGSTNKGAFGRAVRQIPDHEYENILNAGFKPAVQEEILDKKFSTPYQLHDTEQDEFIRPIVERITKRPFRDAAFSKLIKDSYKQTCAMTGLKIINGGGRSEVQAAHIMPVTKNGPDSIRNGIALSATVHWMFDRGLISIGDDYSILKCSNKIPPAVDRMLNPDNQLILPPHILARPHEKYLRFHRENIFKG